jgi:hypothetical protein
VKLTPVSDTVVFELVMVKVSEVVPFSGMGDAPKALEIDGGATTVSVAVLLVVPAPLSFALTAPVVLFQTPAVPPVTDIEIVQ